MLSVMISRGTFVVGAMLGLGLLAIGVLWSVFRFGDRFPVRHVIVITVDTTRADHFGAMGNGRIRTPNLDALARESIVFSDCMTVAPTTLAAHASLFTGKHPHTHGTPRNGFTVNHENRMLAEILAKKKFKTIGFIGSFALDSRFFIAQGFDYYDQVFDTLSDEGDLDQDQRSGRAVTDAVIRYLDEDLPPRLFLFVHYFDPHLPYEPEPPYDSMYGEGQAIDAARVRERASKKPGESFPEAVELASRYGGEVSSMDAQIGRLLRALKDKGVLDNSVLILVSDHGENFWEHHDTFDHGHTLYQSTVQSLCMVRAPDLLSRVETGPVSTVDLFPTLLRYLGLRVPREVEGLALDLRGIPEPARLRFAEATKPWEDVETEGRWFNLYKSRCIREGDWKYVHTPHEQAEELYDLSRDPQERNNVVGEFPDRAKKLRKLLDAWARESNPLESRFDPSQELETIERLRKLRYLDPSEEGGR